MEVQNVINQREFDQIKTPKSLSQQSGNTFNLYNNLDNFFLTILNEKRKTENHNEMPSPKFLTFQMVDSSFPLASFLKSHVLQTHTSHKTKIETAQLTLKRPKRIIEKYRLLLTIQNQNIVVIHGYIYLHIFELME